MGNIPRAIGNCTLLSIFAMDENNLIGLLSLIQVEFPFHSRTLVPYPLISDSDIFRDNLGLAEITSASRPGHVAPRLTRRCHLATCWYSENISPRLPPRFYYLGILRSTIVQAFLALELAVFISSRVFFTTSSHLQPLFDFGDPHTDFTLSADVMGMWRHRVDTPTKLEYFRREFSIPADVHLRLAGEDDSIMPTTNSMPFPVVAFIECGLRLPLDILLREIIHYYKLNPMHFAINSYRVINGIIALAKQENARVTLANIQYCYTMCGLKKDTGYIYYLKSRSTEYKIVADLPDSNKGAGDDYFITSGNWEFAPDEDLHLYPLPRTVFVEGNALPQPEKGFRKSFFPSKGLKKLLDLPVHKRRAPLVLNFIPTYKSVLPDVPKRKKSQSPPSATTPQAASTSRPDQGLTSDPTEQPSTSAPYLIPPSQRKCRRRIIFAAEMGRQKAVAKDLLANIPSTIDAQLAPIQPLKPKQKG
ncbi:hypothetical protein TEA_006598 [Camellia sinensis var. sinensis]|uniref:Uncharacterized protein n=1 Tax=Camellia sinensis var. sinensis TaxID=542762 RepID=A0A4S4EQK2_CAMSN|nr:hypothetical protein TEA_006598 [Camellia sinensis var. sinensis]